MAVVIGCPFPQHGSTEDSIQTLGLCIGRSRCYGRGFVVGEGKLGTHRKRLARWSGAQS